MSIIQRATQALVDAEAALKRLIGEAAANGEYASVEKLARWASNLDEIRSEERGYSTPLNGSPPQANIPPNKAVTASKSKSSKPSNKRRSYPIFAKSSDTLVKIGWSKSSKSEYQHKCSWTVVKNLAETLARHGRNGSVVSMDSVLPLKADDSSDVPDYQVYVGLAWIRQIGAVKQNGRQGYVIKQPGVLGEIVESAWSQLSELKPS